MKLPYSFLKKMFQYEIRNDKKYLSYGWFPIFTVKERVKSRINLMFR